MTANYDRTFLAIDYGSRRIGLAKSDPMGIIASALETLTVKSMTDTVAKVGRVIAEYQPNAIVVGYPLHESGEKSVKCTEIDLFITKLSVQYKGPIHRVDEFDSSNEAMRIVHAHGKKAGQDKARIDKLAAVIILQRFLEANPS
jgi:putative holliday junction resolvase